MAKVIKIIILILLSSKILFATTDLCQKQVQKIKKEAEKGNEIQQYTMGILYKNGICVKHNITKAIKWFSLSSEQGYPLARYTLGDIYHFGEGIPINNKKAEKYYLKILKDKDEEIFTRLGNIYLIGKGIEHNASLAKDFYLFPAEEHYVPALNNLGMMYFNGMGVDVNFTKASIYLKEAALKGNKNAQFYFAMSLSRIDNKKYNKKILQWLTKSAQNGFLKAELVLGYGYIKGDDVKKDMKKAQYWIKKAKDQNSSKAVEVWNKYELWKY